MTAREKADERLGAALDRIAARLAEPFTARDVTGDLGIGEAFERDYGIDQSGARGAARVDHADRRQAMMAPPRKQAEQAALDRLFVGGRQDSAAARDGGVAGQKYVPRRASPAFTSAASLCGAKGGATE